jgi:spermidine/putrescine transport system substrate-binding protein
MNLKRLVFRTAVLGLAATLWAGCARKPALHVYIWSDYIDPEIVKEFEARHGCRVVMDYYDSNETLYAKLRAGGTGYDVVFPSSYMVNVMRQQDMLLSLDLAKLPNAKHLDPAMKRFTMDPDHRYSLPYMLGTTGIGYLKSKVPDFKPTWKTFAQSAHAGRMTLLNDMRETLGAALKALGHSLNTTNQAELAAAGDLARQWKKNIAKFESEQYKNGLISGEFLVVHGYSGDVMQTMEENKDVAYAVPEEGASVALDDMAILKTAPRPDLAHAFLNYLHEPAVAARNIEFVYYLCPNLEAYKRVSEEVRSNPSIFLAPQVMERCEVIVDLGAANALYTKVWDAVKAE